MTSLLLLPPFAFLVILLVVGLGFRLLRVFAFVPPRVESDSLKAYGCGETWPDHKVRPDYSEFFLFAFFFTIMHVVAMMVATLPPLTLEVAGIAAAYVLGAVLCLGILFRK